MARLNLVKIGQHSVECNTLGSLATSIKQCNVCSTWNARDFAWYAKKVLYFLVSGNRLTGRIFISHNGKHMYNVYICNRKNDIVHEVTNVPYSQLIDIIDEHM